MVLKVMIGTLVILAISFSAKSQADHSKPELTSVVTGIDHVPVVVPDLTVAKSILSDVLKFTVKNGRVHEGINNFFVKFQDGTYLEFVTPVDTAFAIGKYYSDFMSRRTGGTSLALSVNAAKATAQLLKQRHIPFTSQSNPIWNSIELAQHDLFYIEYKDKAWKERLEFTTHQNASIALKSVWWISKETANDASAFLTLGFTDGGTSTPLSVNARVLNAHATSLNIIDSSDRHALLSHLKSPETDGIVGFTIQVKSLDTVKQALGSRQMVVIGKQLIYYLKEFNFFIAFSE